MVDRIDEHNIQQKLSAFADGELTSAQMAQVLDYLASHRDVLDHLRAHQRFRASASSVLRDQVPPVSDALRKRIEQIAADAKPADESPLKIRPSTARPWWQWAAAAAMLIVGFSAGRLAYFSGTNGTGGGINTTASVVPVSVISHAAAIHADCSRLARGLHTAPYPADLGGLAESVKRDLARNEPYPDLEPIGFIYEGAGPCGSPLPNTLHLLYKSKDLASNHAVSVFVQPNDHQFKMEAGKLYSLSDSRSPFPILAWQTDRVIYFLIADDAQTLEKARSHIGPAAALQAADSK